MSRFLANHVVIVVLLMLTACGFHLKGSTGGMTLPPELKTLFIQGADTNRNDFGRALKRGLQQNDVEVLSDFQKGQAVLKILKNDYKRQILSVGSDAKVRELTLMATVDFEVIGPDGNIIAEKQRVEAQREYEFDNTEVLAMTEQERVLKQDLNLQMVESLMRRLSAIK